MPLSKKVKNRIDYDNLVFKIRQLTCAVVYFLQSEIAMYWKVNKGKQLKIDAFVETLL